MEKDAAELLSEMNGQYIEDNIEILREYWAENFVEMTHPDDEWEEHFNYWLDGQDFKDLRDIILSKTV